MTESKKNRPVAIFWRCPMLRPAILIPIFVVVASQTAEITSPTTGENLLRNGFIEALRQGWAMRRYPQIIDACEGS